MPKPSPKKFDEATFRHSASDFAKYLKAAWKISVETAEECVAAPPDLDDAEARDMRRKMVWDLANVFLEKIIRTYGG